MIKYCPKCLDCTMIDLQAFCRNDGEVMLPIKTCECGTEIMPSPVNKFCIKCGKEVPVDIYL